MPEITLEDFKVPNTCGECGFIGHYESGPFSLCYSESFCNM